MNDVNAVFLAEAQRWFTQDQPKADMDNFKTVIIGHPDQVEVVFGPKLVPREETGVVTLGGKNRYGQEVHYYIDRDTHQMIRREFAK